MTPSSNYAMISCSSTSNGWYFQMVGDASGSPGVAFQSTQNPSVYDYNSCNTGSYYSVGFSTTVYTLSITTTGCNGGVNNGYSESLPSFLSFFPDTINANCSSPTAPSVSDVGSSCMFTNCDSSPCTAGSTCTDFINYYTCISPSYCTSNPCVHGSCISGTSNYTCNCTASGYTGTNCTTGKFFFYFFLIYFSFLFFFFFFFLPN